MVREPPENQEGLALPFSSQGHSRTMGSSPEMTLEAHELSAGVLCTSLHPPNSRSFPVATSTPGSKTFCL